MRFLAIYISLLALLVSCSDDKKPSVTAAPKTQVVVAVTPTLDCLPFYIARYCGIADTMGIDLELVECPSLADCDTALLSGHAAAIASDYVRASSLKERWVALMARHASQPAGRSAPASRKTTPADSLVIYPHQNTCLYLFVNGKSRIKEAKQLADKMVAGDRYGADAAFASYVIDSVGLSGKTYLVQMQNIATRTMMIEDNMMDAAVVPEPQATLLRMTGHKQLYSAAHVKADKAGCVIARRNHDLIRDMYNRACDSISRNGLHHYDTLIVRQSGLPLKAVRSIPQHKLFRLE